MKQNPSKNKTEVQYLFKGDPGTYGKGKKQVTTDDLVQIRKNSNIPSLPVSTPIGIYHRKKTEYLSQNKLINILFGLSIIILILLKFVFIDFFNSTREKNLELIISNLCFAYIASFIFYAIVIKRSDKHKKIEAYAIICGLNDSLLSHGKNVKKWIHKGTEKEDEIGKLKDSMDRQTFKRICAQVDLNKIPNGYQASIGSLILLDGVRKINTYIEKVFNYMPFLEGELIHQLNKIQNSKFSRTILLIPHKAKNGLEEFSNDIFDFLILLEELENYNDSLKKKYLENYEKKY
ncbi:hypothetical protein [Christiangramia echinicola]|uniref:hypothetical protein n=1 Tax=Christiangramia echinicola TaxID=279359 RepID=UPI000422A435|nr:hypothetical protein [Christiangramia echinicola]